MIPRSAPLLAVSLALAGCGGPEPEPARPDVLLVVVDTLRADRLGCYGYGRGTTPHLDALAERGVVFRRNWSQAPWTVPSMASMITSRYPTAHQERPDEHATTLAECFRAAGYVTIAVVANQLLSPGAGFERGFDVYVGREDEQGHRKDPGDFRTILDWIDPELRAALTPGPDGTRPPLFLYVHPSDPHDPYHGRKEYLPSLPLESVPPILPPGWQEARLAELGPPPPEDDPGWRDALRRIRQQRNAYDHEVHFSDEVLGELLGRLEGLGVPREELLVAFVSDHGEELWEHVTAAPKERLRELEPKDFFFQTHGYHLSEQALRTPFLLAGPGIPRGAVIDAPVENVDLFPTLVGLCGLERPGDLHGLDLRPLMQGALEPADWRRESYAYVMHAVSVRDEEHDLKLVLPTEYGMERKVGEPLLIDLGADPLERTNLYAERPEDARRLTERVLAYLERFASDASHVDGERADEMRRRMQEMGYAGLLVGEDDEGEQDGGGE